MPAWNDNPAFWPWDVAVSNMLIDAFNERVVALSTSGASPVPPTFAAVTAGQTSPGNIGLSLFLFVLQTLCADGDAIYGNMPRWWKTAPPISTTPGAYPGIAPTYDQGTLFTAAGVSGGKFTRKRYREITSLADTLDTQGNTIANGMYARCIVTGTPSNPSAWSVYHRVAGAWVPISTWHDADVLSNKSAAPNAVTSDALGGPDDGRAQVGDIFGSWIITELMSAYNVMKETYSFPVAQLASYSYKEADGLFSTGDPYTDAATKWANIPPNASDPDSGSNGEPAPPGFYIGSWCLQQSGGDVYLHRSQATPTFTAPGHVGGPVPTCDLWTFIDSTFGAGFSDDGDTIGGAAIPAPSLLANQPVLMQSFVAPTPGATLSGPQVGDITGARPDFNVTLPAKGWRLGFAGSPNNYDPIGDNHWARFLTVNKWVVAGGIPVPRLTRNTQGAISSGGGARPILPAMDNTMASYAAAIALVIHALASGAVQIIRAWKQPVTIAKPAAAGPAPINPVTPKGNTP